MLLEASARIEEARRENATKLDLSSLDLTKLPESISQLGQLQKLNLSNNQLSELPASISQLSQLHELFLDDNQLSELPESIGQLSQLQILNLSNNQLSELPVSIGQLSQLQSLDLSGNQLSELPASISELRQLQSLNLDSNQLRELPARIGELSQLHTLNLDNNQLSMLLTSISHLSQLWFLSLSNNQLSELPASISQLSQLQRLFLDNNQLSELPESIKKLTSLKELYLQGNERLGLSAEVLGPDWQEVVLSNSQPADPTTILNYYFEVLKVGSRPLNEAKLILVGRGGVGKTSLVNQLVYHRFNQGERKTEGINITEWPLVLNRDENVRLNVWDFGGQEIMHATHQFFLTQRSLYLLVLNGREGGEDADAEYWLKLIESFGDESPVIVVLNKIKEHPFDLNRRALEQKYPIREFIKTDCQDGTGIKELRKAIERETDRLEHLRDPFPASWFSIKDKLAGIKKNFLSFEEYRKVCARQGEKGGKEQELLAGYLHNLGIVLNYRDDARLQHTQVLNPHWVTKGIYKVLNAEKLEKQKGEIRLHDLSAILDGRKYPANMHSFLFDLMKKFDLCFSFPDEETRFLIPELLDKQEAKQTEEFKPEECLNFQYHYPVLPEGLLPRFIVRTHALSEGLPRWRTGVILKFGDCLALVKADVQDKRVFISVSGSPPSRRRELLAVIRFELDKIHHSIRSLNPQAMVPVPQYPKFVVPYDELLVMEQSRMKKFPKVVEGKVIELDVQELLNGVDLEGTRRKDRGFEARGGALRLFYSYSHKDESLRVELETHLRLLQLQGLIEAWHDREIEAGHEWEPEIKENLERADIILLLVSANFIASYYCWEEEMKRALERHERKEARVIPVIVRAVNWKKAPFAKLQALPKDGLAVTKWRDKDSAWQNVSEGIERVIEEMRKKFR